MRYPLPLLALLLSATAIADEPLRFEVAAREIANLTYQLDCVSGAIPACSRGAYVALWEEQLLRDEGDRAALERWRAVRGRYSETVELPLAVALPLGRRGDILSLAARLRLAGLLSETLDDYRDRLDVLVLPADRAALVEVVTRFEPRFRPIWKKRAPALKAFAAELAKLLGRPDVVALANRMRVFYDSQVPSDRALPFVLLDRPPSSDKATNGEQVDGASLLEVVPGEKASARLDVALHELSHFFYFTARAETVAAMQQRFADSRRPSAIAAYRLMDEAIATAFGNGLISRLVTPADFQRRLARPQGFYRDADIDRSAKALLPWLDGWLAAGRTVSDPAFVDAYLDVLQKEYGPELDAPRLAMFSLVFFEDEALGGRLRDEVRKHLHVNNMSAVIGTLDDPEVAGWYRDAHGTAVFVVRPDHVAGLVPLNVLSAEEAKAIGTAVPVVFGKARAGGERLYIVVTADAAGAVKAFAAFAAARAAIEGRRPLPAE